jgi:hypothetical protein
MLLSKDSFLKNLMLKEAENEGRLKRRISIDKILLEDLMHIRKLIADDIEKTYSNKYNVNDSKFKFINHKFMEIGMIPNNPTIMYNCLETESVDNIILGQPIYNNKFAGIVSKIDAENNHIYSIPTNYILNALNRKNNTNIYSLNEDINKTYCSKDVLIG